MKISDDAKDMADLKRAVSLLETPSISIQMANLIGTPIEWGLARLPAVAKRKIHSAVSAAMRKAVSAALWTMDDKPSKAASNRSHKLATATTGAISGFFGPILLWVELPITTTIMMRSVADVARSEGFSLADFSVQMACVEVFSMGGASTKDDAAESGYYAARGAVAEIAKHTTNELAAMAAKRGAKNFTTKQAGTWLAKLIDAVATRFSITITEKMAAQIVPVISAATGATINAIFTGHYQNMARGHFIVKRLEEKYGEPVVQSAYERLMKPAQAP